MSLQNNDLCANTDAQVCFLPASLLSLGKLRVIGYAPPTLLTSVIARKSLLRLSSFAACLRN